MDAPANLKNKRHLKTSHGMDSPGNGNKSNPKRPKKTHNRPRRSAMSISKRRTFALSEGGSSSSARSSMPWCSGERSSGWRGSRRRRERKPGEQKQDNKGLFNKYICAYIYIYIIYTYVYLISSGWEIQQLRRKTRFRAVLRPIFIA